MMFFVPCMSDVWIKLVVVSIAVVVVLLNHWVSKIALYGNPSQSYGASPAMLVHYSSVSGTGAS